MARHRHEVPFVVEDRRSRRTGLRIGAVSEDQVPHVDDTVVMDGDLLGPAALPLCSKDFGLDPLDGMATVGAELKSPPVRCGGQG